MVLTVIGRITGEAKAFTPNGSEKTKLTFSVANNDYSKKVEGEYIDVPMFYEVSFWVKNVEYWTAKIKPGNSFACAGSNLHLNVWKDNNDNPRAVVCVDLLGNPDITPKTVQNGCPY